MLDEQFAKLLEFGLPQAARSPSAATCRCTTTEPASLGSHHSARIVSRSTVLLFVDRRGWRHFLRLISPGEARRLHGYLISRGTMVMYTLGLEIRHSVR